MARTHRVLAVDDSLGVLTLIGTYLQGSEFVVTGTARDGKAAVARYAKLKPDVVLLDIVMPEQGGQETLRQILAADGGARVGMISSLDDPEIIDECTTLGARSFLKKPFSKQDLIDFLRGLVAPA
jgi:two-component system chemotaxis response regulator CheY